MLPEVAVFSGDTVRKDAEGFLYFVGRRDVLDAVDAAARCVEGRAGDFARSVARRDTGPARSGHWHARVQQEQPTLA